MEGFENFLSNFARLFVSRIGDDRTAAISSVIGWVKTTLIPDTEKKWGFPPSGMCTRFFPDLKQYRRCWSKLDDKTDKRNDQEKLRDFIRGIKQSRPKGTSRVRKMTLCFCVALRFCRLPTLQMHVSSG